MKLHYCFSENALQGTPWAKIWLGSIVHGLTWANIMVHKVVHGWSWACSFLRILSVLHPASQYFDDIWYTNSHAGIIFRCRRSSNTSLYCGCRWYFISSLFCIDDLASEITNDNKADYPPCTGVSFFQMYHHWSMLCPRSLTRKFDEFLCPRKIQICVQRVALSLSRDAFNPPAGGSHPFF